MSVVKEVYDFAKILASHPELREWLEKNAVKLSELLWRQIRGLSRSEKFELQKLTAEIIRNSEFKYKFPSDLSYFETLLSTIVQSVQVKERGVLISDFYLPKAILYFPPISAEMPPLIRSKHKDYSDSGFVIGKFGLLARYYGFYAITDCSEDKREFQELRSLLDRIVWQPRRDSEDGAFERELNGLGKKLERVEVLRFHLQKVYEFFYKKRNPNLILSSENPQKTRDSIVDDLQYLHNFDVH